MKTDQAQPTAVDVLLASIDEVLADTAPARSEPDPAPAAAPSESPAPHPPDHPAEPSAPPVQDQADKPLAAGSPESPRPSRPKSGPDTPRGRTDDWWDNVYKSQEADLDTNTGNLPADRRPSRPATTPPPLPPIHGGSPATAVVDLDKEAAEPDTAEQEPADAPQPEQETTTSRGRRIVETLFVQKTDSDNAEPKGPNHRLRQLAYNGTAAGAGWGFGLVTLFEHVVDGANTYAAPITAVALAAGITSVALRIKGSGFVLVGALGLTTIFQMVTPAYVVGIGIVLCLWPVDARLRIWLQRADPTSKAWKAVAWVLRIPLATTAIAFILHGTN
ncbi:hypothetical protein [Streptomyces anulatus]|uniref:hypothetical protein n=1 Tax=Streptomyces anulatus TaxID=1892 RepID=UPI001C26AE78|nr:hypothetical protein [Streptomyces anulatus]